MPEAWHNAGAALLRIGKPAEADPYLRRAIELYDMLVTAIVEVDRSGGDEKSTGFLFEEDDSADDSWSQEPENMKWYDDDEEPDFEIRNEDLYGEEPIAYYLFWKACCYGLLNEKEPLLEALSRCVAEDDWYAIEAGVEEDLSTFHQDPDFVQLIQPVVSRISSPEHRHLFEIFESIEKRILIGFEDPAEFVDDVIEEVEAEKWVDRTPYTWIKKTTKDLYQKHEERSKTWEQPTDVIRLAEVFSDLCKDGILALHKTGHTQIEAIDEVTDIMNDMVLSPELIKGFCFYNGENVEELIYKEKGSLHITFNSILLDDPQFGITIGTIVANRLREKGFQINWDGTMKSRIELLDFSWKKVFISDADQQQWDHWRVFDLF
jgi:hypothetical protein